MLNRDYQRLAEKYLAPVYSQYPVAFVKGKGTFLWDCEGKKYIDFSSGIATVSLGHCHPKIVSALKDQAGRLWHVSNLYLIPWQIELAKLLVENTFASKVFFCNSGAEANEAAVKFARLWGKRYRNGAYKIITAVGSFHGRTLAMVSATGQDKIKEGFAPLPEGFVHVPFNNIESIESAIDSETVAVMVEPVQGEGGVVKANEEYIKELRFLCHKNNLLLIFDEVQTGIGRCGSLFAYSLYQVEPDILTSAKGLGSGFPIAATLINDKVSSSIHTSSHASTFGGNPLAARIGYEVVKTIIDDGVLDNVRICSEVIFNFFKRKNFSLVEEVRGLGLLIGIKLKVDVKSFVLEALKKGLLLVPAADNVVRILPPLTATVDEIESGLAVFEDVILSFD